MAADGWASFFQALRQRALPDGSFAVAPGTGSRPDATAWAAVALQAAGLAPELAAAARQSLAAAQSPDGSVPVLPERPTAVWPTGLAILAWLPDPEFAPQAAAAVAWLLGHPGQHWPRQEGGVFGHDTDIKGWPWIEGTHSWVEPTSQAVLALTAAGQAGQAQVAEAARLLLDRQLPDGGWNYGNTRVFRNMLLPVPESTGFALTALAALSVPNGRPDRSRVAASLNYLAGPECAVATPLAAAWRAFGLTAWEAAPPDALANLGRALDLQARYGPYDTPLLAQVLAAAASQGRFSALTKGA